MNASQTLLVVDDDPDALGFAARTLTEQGYDVRKAGIWTEALDALSQGRPDLVLLDLELPGIRGDALLEFIREQHKDLPVVIASAEIDGPAMEALGELGARGFIRKPYDTDDLLLVVEQVLLENAVLQPPPRAAAAPRVQAPLPTRGRVAPGAGVETLNRNRPGTSPLPDRPRERRWRKRKPGTLRKVRDFVLAAVLLVVIGLALFLIQQSFSGGFLGIGIQSEVTVE